MNSKKIEEISMSRYFRHLIALSVACLIALMILCGGAAEAQTFRGTVLGTVTDSSGAAVAGAAVQVKNIDTGLTRTVTTSVDGSYAAPELPIG